MVDHPRDAGEHPRRPEPTNNRGPYMQWTQPQLRRLRDRRKAGESTAELAAEVGVTDNALRQAWRNYIGYESTSAYRRERNQEARDRRVWALRQEKKTYREIAAILGEPWEGKRTFNRLRMGCRRYAKRLKLVNPKGRADRS